MVGGSEVLVWEGKLGTHTHRCTKDMYKAHELTGDAHRSHSAHAHITPSTNTDTHRSQVAHIQITYYT